MQPQPQTTPPVAPTAADQAPAQAPAPLPAAPSSPSVTVTLPDGPLPLEGLPRNAQEVHGLHARRDILRDQLVRANNRREELVAQLQHGGAEEARVGIQQRLSLLDERILQIEREQALTERLLSNAPPEVLALSSEPMHSGAMIHEEEAAVAAFGTFWFGVLVAVIVGRVRRGRARRRGATPAAAVLADDPRLEQLTQAVDAIAVEVERIGEGQRFVTQLLASRGSAPAYGAEAERR